jgi:hypothetical protein
MLATATARTLALNTSNIGVLAPAVIPTAVTRDLPATRTLSYQRIAPSGTTVIKCGSAVMGFYVNARNLNPLAQATGWCYAATVLSGYDSNDDDTHEFDYRLRYD